MPPSSARLTRRVAIACVILLAGSAPARASDSASVMGVVLDAANAPIAGATVDVVMDGVVVTQVPWSPGSMGVARVPWRPWPDDGEGTILPPSVGDAGLARGAGN